MSSILAEYVLWKSIRQKREDEYENQESQFSLRKSDEIVFPNEMICRVCTSPADIPITSKIDGINISCAIRTVSYIWVSSTDSYPKYICKNCLEELKVALAFKKKCEASDSWFRQTQSRKASSDSWFRQTQSRKTYNHAASIVKHDFTFLINQMMERRSSQLAIKREHGSSESKKVNVWGLTENNVGNKDTSKKIIKCQRCDLTFDSKELLKEHRVKQICICPPCPICGKLVSNLGRHKKTVHLRTEKYTCHICGKICYTAGSLRNHLLLHSDKCNFPCPLCPYKGKQQAYLTLHMRIHTGERPYLCSECPAKFVNPSNLRKHQLTHSSKKFECSKCKKQFRLKKSLQEHYDAAHLNVRYRCTVCGRDLWTRRKLLSHELRVHNREKHKLYKEVHKVVLNDKND
ncbi:oocyte zinc finger protein XlCOF7.1-like [Cydia fagiglandana]|uniref:oocyte zinc finger protein XlCOF7.1-like n=1 Tax=Cydia fagiglandana TaxID=1458189 RepID=UPI002FEE3678